MTRAEILWLIGAALIAGGILVWFLTVSPLTGTVSVTRIGADGIASAGVIHLKTKALTPPTLPTPPSDALLAAVPNPKGDKLALLSRTRDAARHVIIQDAITKRMVSVRDGLAESPTWSPDGGSIAFAEFEHASTTNAGDPTNWTVVRAVSSGPALVVGEGYHPYPSAGQRTYALTAHGIALLSYADSEPTLVVQSPTPVPVSTPFAVSTDGMRIAWVAPADKSLQVFNNVNGYFVPLLVTNVLHPQSITFSPDGKYLLGVTTTGATSTLSLITVKGGAVSTVGEYSGFLKLHTWVYEK